MAFEEFVFAMTDALVQQIVGRLDALEWTVLSAETIDESIPAASRRSRGVYLLGYSDGRMTTTVYVGQSNTAVYTRLQRHAKALSDRYRLPKDTIFFKAMGVVIFESVLLEARLVKEYKTKWKKSDNASGWNGSGFGSNDTGGNRDAQRASGFDTRFPIDLSIPKPGLLEEGTYTVRAVFDHLKSRTPYTIRLAPAVQKDPELTDREITVSNGNIPVLSGLYLLLGELSHEWTVNIYHSRVVFSKDRVTSGNIAINPETWPPDQWKSGPRTAKLMAILRRDEQGSR